MIRIDRYELKFTVPKGMVAGICSFIAPYCRFDGHSEASPDHRYTVNSLYLDTPRHLFLRQRLEKVEKRFNMRIRAYGDHPKPPFFLEVKHRTGDIIRKFRSRIADEDVEGALRLDAEPESQEGEAGHAAMFRNLAHAYDARPQVLIQYRRMAFVSTCDEYARVTFDEALRYAPREGYSPVPIEAEMAGCDPETLFDEGSGVILELKCPASAVPLWMVDLVRAFELRRRGFSKFTAGMAQVFRRYDPVDGAARSRWDGMGHGKD